MTQHTAGPWSIDAAGDIFARNELIAIPCGSNYGNWRDADDGGEAEFNANARLIAAAPELLEALQLVLSENTKTARDVARAAIAKAVQ